MTSQTFLMTSSVTSFDRKFKRVFDQTEHCITFLLALNLGELYCEFSRLKAKTVLSVKVWCSKHQRSQGED